VQSPARRKSYMKEYRARHAAFGDCISCTELADPGYTKCAKCRQRDRTRTRRRKRKRPVYHCRYCGSPRHTARNHPERLTPEQLACKPRRRLWGAK
jgi:hypothetical protein